MQVKKPSDGAYPQRVAEDLLTLRSWRPKLVYRVKKQGQLESSMPSPSVAVSTLVVPTLVSAADLQVQSDRTFTSGCTNENQPIVAVSVSESESRTTSESTILRFADGKSGIVAPVWSHFILTIMVTDSIELKADPVQQHGFISHFLSRTIFCRLFIGGFDPAAILSVISSFHHDFRRRSWPC